MTRDYNAGEAVLGTRRLVLATVTTNVLGNLFLSHGMREVGQTVSLSPLPYLEAFLNPWVSAGVTLLAVWIVSQLCLLSRADLTYVLPVTSASYVLAALTGLLFLREHISMARWGGILLIGAGVALVSRTAPRAHRAPLMVKPPATVFPLGVEE